MSKTSHIVCSICGRDLYVPLTIKERRRPRSYKKIEYYIVNYKGIEDELCSNCFNKLYLKKED